MNKSAIYNRKKYMKLVIRTITGERINVEINSYATIHEIKEKIAPKLRTTAELLSLIYNAEDLPNNITIRNTSIQESSTIVAFVRKGKASDYLERIKTNLKKEKEAQKNAEKEKEVPKKTEQKQEKKIQLVSQVPANKHDSTHFDESDAILNELPNDEKEVNEKINRLVKMGFDQRDSIMALKMTGFNENLAINLLLDEKIPKTDVHSETDKQNEKLAQYLIDILDSYSPEQKRDLLNLKEACDNLFVALQAYEAFDHNFASALEFIKSA